MTSTKFNINTDTIKLRLKLIETKLIKLEYEVQKSRKDVTRHLTFTDVGREGSGVFNYDLISNDQNGYTVIIFHFLPTILCNK